ncbi:MAG: ABC transporter ATP-binding protein [Chthoniobacteraceae bacterium]
MIRLDNLRKSFKGKPALHGVSFAVPTGEIFGLLGHNGAGKSTTFGIMLGQVYPDAGEAWIGDVSVQKDRARALSQVGAIFETPSFYEYLSGWRNLEILVNYSRRVERRQLEEAVETVGLTGRIHDPVRTYSHGMRQRLALAQAILPSPKLVLLDEPTEGLDPEGIHEMRLMIQRLNQERGLTVLLSSHLLSEVEQLCSRVAILNKGRLIFNGRWSELAGDGQRFRLEVDDWARAGEIVTNFGGRSFQVDLVELPPDGDIANLVRALVEAGIALRGVTRVQPSLESLYLEAISNPSGHAS